MDDVTRSLSEMLPRGGRLAIGDGAGTPHEAWSSVIELLEERADVSLVLGWWFTAPALDGPLRGERAKTLFSGFGLRRLIDAGKVGFVPCRFSQVSALLAGALRADVLVTSLRPTRTGFAFSTEVGWERAVIDAGGAVAAVVRTTAPAIPSGPELAAASVRVLAESAQSPELFVTAPPSEL